MGMSLYLSVDQHMHYIQMFDNLLIGKLMYDYGKPLPKETNFTKTFYVRDHRFFITAIEFLYDCKAQILDGENEDDVFEMEEFNVLLEWDLARRWNTIKEKCISREYNLYMTFCEQENVLMDTIRTSYCPYHEVEVRSTLQQTGILLQVGGYQGTFFSILHNHIMFVRSFSEMVINSEKQLVQLEQEDFLDETSSD